MEEPLKPVFFDSREMGDPDLNYVCWLDVMGTRNQMLRSLPVSASFIFKLHSAVLEAYDQIAGRESLQLYPVMDGVFITSPNKHLIMELLGASLRHLAETFVQEVKIHHRFLPRGAIAFGPVVHGKSVKTKASWVLANHKDVCHTVLVGLPMAQAYNEERKAPPFGIAIHSSSRGFAPPGEQPFRFIWWDWLTTSRPKLDAKVMSTELARYFEWHRSHTNTTGYEADAIKRHSVLAEEYFCR